MHFKFLINLAQRKVILASFSRLNAMYIMSNLIKLKSSQLLACILVIMLSGLLSCKKEEQNPNIPVVYINITIDPNSTMFQPLNTSGGWMYLTSNPPSRGIIVYRSTQDEFLAYDRIPPNDPNHCCESSTNCTRLVVGDNFPFVKDDCLGITYSILDGGIFQGEGKWPMIRYNTTYNGQYLRIFN